MREELVSTRQEDALVGQVMADRYQILSLIGEGGIGLVYKANHTLMNRVVAIKLIRSELVQNQTLLQRFQQEAQAISKLNHPNIVEVYDFGVSTDGRPYLVMDYLEGISLSELLTTEGKMTVERAMPLFLQACHALKHAHEKGIIHRDFKASNLMICQDSIRGEVVKVVDFGMAKLLKADREGTDDQELTKLGEVFGSPLYMSPEQCRGQQLDERSDIYALACVMYYTLTGRPPFLGENVLDTLQKHINEDAVTPSQYQSSISADLDSIVLKALRKCPEERYQNMHEMLLDLESVNNGEGCLSNTVQMKRPEFKRRKKFWNRTIETDIVFAAVIGIAMIAMTAFTSGRMFQAADESQEMNMWVDHNLDGDKARARHDWVSAEKHYKDAITEAAKFGRNDPRLAKTLVSLGLTYIEDKQYDRAETTLKRAIHIYEKCYGPDCFEESTTLLALTRAYEEQGRDAEAQEYRQRAVSVMQSEVGHDRRLSLHDNAIRNATKK